MPGGQADDAFLQDVTQCLHDRFDMHHVTLQAVRLAITTPCAPLDPSAFPCGCLPCGGEQTPHCQLYILIGVKRAGAGRSTVISEHTTMKVKVLGSGCSKCRSTIGIIERAARDAGVEVEIVKVEHPDEIKAFGVHATPAVVINGQVVHSGGIPSHEAVQAWLGPARAWPA
jgi:small redox-active disulfide protein 2